VERTPAYDDTMDMTILFLWKNSGRYIAYCAELDTVRIENAYRL
jgi:hypothetical protein